MEDEVHSAPSTVSSYLNSLTYYLPSSLRLYLYSVKYHYHTRHRFLFCTSSFSVAVYCFLLFLGCSAYYKGIQVVGGSSFGQQIGYIITSVIAFSLAPLVLSTLHTTPNQFLTILSSIGCIIPFSLPFLITYYLLHSRLDPSTALSSQINLVLFNSFTFVGFIVIALLRCCIYSPFNFSSNNAYLLITIRIIIPFSLFFILTVYYLYLYYSFQNEYRRSLNGYGLQNWDSLREVQTKLKRSRRDFNFPSIAANNPTDSPSNYDPFVLFSPLFLPNADISQFPLLPSPACSIPPHLHILNILPYRITNFFTGPYTCNQSLLSTLIPFSSTPTRYTPFSSFDTDTHILTFNCPYPLPFSLRLSPNYLASRPYATVDVSNLPFPPSEIVSIRERTLLSTVEKQRKRIFESQLKQSANDIGNNNNDHLEQINSSITVQINQDEWFELSCANEQAFYTQAILDPIVVNRLTQYKLNHQIQLPLNIPIEKKKSIIVFMLDAVSKSQFYRRMPETVTLLEKIHKKGRQHYQNIEKVRLKKQKIRKKLAQDLDDHMIHAADNDRINYSNSNNNEIVYSSYPYQLHHILGHNTRVNQQALLCASAGVECDNENFIGNIMKKNGYLTGLIVNECVDYLTDFFFYQNKLNRLLNKFDNENILPIGCHPDYDHNGKWNNLQGPYSMTGKRCIKEKPIQEYLFNYLNSFIQLANKQDVPFFAFVALVEGHEGSMEVLKTLDKPLSKFIKQLTSTDTSTSSTADDDQNSSRWPVDLFLWGDHGLHMGPMADTHAGKMEHKLPLLIWLYREKTLEEALQDNKNPLLRNMRENMHKNLGGGLITAKEIYWTFREIAEGRKEKEKDFNTTVLLGQVSVQSNNEKGELINYYEPQNLSLFDLIPLNRTCEKAGIPHIHCVCENRGIGTS